MMGGGVTGGGVGVGTRSRDWLPPAPVVSSSASPSAARSVITGQLVR